MGQDSVFGKVLSNIKLPDTPTVGIVVLTLEATELPEKNIYDTPVKIKYIVTIKITLNNLFLLIVF